MTKSDELTPPVMESAERVARLERIKQGDPESSMTIYYSGQRKPIDVFRIPVDVLIYNSHNGRIASQVLTRAKESGASDEPESQEMQEAVDQYLWDSSEPRNKATKKNLKNRGQLRPGIVTADGIVVDGNRRLMLLRRLKKEDPTGGRYDYFEASILSDKLSDNSREIMRLETIFQMGEDEKVGYGAIEKYLKCKEMKRAEFSEQDIADAMNESEAQIKEYLRIMDLMDKYLEYCGHDGYYTLLKDTEGVFVDLTGYLSVYRGKRSTRVKWNYGNNDVEDLQQVYFDIIRAQAADEEKGYRNIGRTSNRQESFFTRKDVWEDFLQEHRSQADKVAQEADELKQETGESREKFYERQNEYYEKETKRSFNGRIKKFKKKLDDLNEEAAPVVFLQRAKDALEKVNPDRDGFYEKSAKSLVKEVNKISWDFKKLHDKKGKSSS